MDFVKSLTEYTRRPTVEVRIGGVTIGGGHRVAPQSMTNTDTMDTAACAAQIERLYRAGCLIMRLTAPGRREGENLAAIRRLIDERGLREVALVADVHYTPDVAMIAADHVEKVRINPGNYKDGAGERFDTLIEKCRSRHVSLRIGVNHGSLSPHIVDRWGDTPRGMVESAMEFLRECRRLDFGQVVVSMKSSNVRVMVHAYRLLAAEMAREGMRYPLHLGVTEAGDGAQGRIKSAVGIGALLADGIGDTIRVSLTEPPENEIPVAQKIIAHFEGYGRHRPIEAIHDRSLYSPFEYRRRRSDARGNVGGGNLPVLFGELDGRAAQAREKGEIAVIEAVTGNPAAEWRAAILNMEAAGDRRPVILHRRYAEGSLEDLQIKAAADFGMLFIDGLADGIHIENKGIPQEELDETALMILQAARVRMSRTEFIACPGCGRTLFDLQKVLAEVRSRTSHLKGLKIGVMGCIVNGPGEMADADYGYVGAGTGKVTLYKNREVIRREIPQSEAIEALVELIKQNGDWTQP